MPDDDPVLENGKRLSELKVVELKEELNKYGLSKVGNKNVLYERLKEHLTQADEVTSSGGGSADESKAEAAVNPFVAAYKSEQEKALKRARHDAEKVRLNTSESDIDAPESANTSINEPETKRLKADSDKESTSSKQEDSERASEESREEQKEDSEVAEEKEAEEPADQEMEQEEEAEKSPEPESPQKIDEDAPENEDSSKATEETEDHPLGENDRQETTEEGDEEEAAMVDVKECEAPKEEMHSTDVEAESGSVSQEESSIDIEADHINAEEEEKDAPEDESNEQQENEAAEESSEEADVSERRRSEEAESSTASPEQKSSEEKPAASNELFMSTHNEDELDFDEEIPNGSQDTEHEATSEDNVKTESEKKEDDENVDEAPDTVVGDTRTTVDGFLRVRAVSPARHANECVIHIHGLTRPFTNKQMTSLLSKYGEYDEQSGFWIDKVKSNCMVKYHTKSEAALARYRLHHVAWPAGNKNSPLSVDFTTAQKLEAHLSEDGFKPSATPKRLSLSSTQMNLTITIDNKDAKKNHESTSTEARKSSLDSKEEILARRSERFKSDSREGEATPSKKRKEDDPNTEKRQEGFDLGALFRRTEATPHIYYLPLTDKQIERKEKERAAKKSRPSR